MARCAPVLTVDGVNTAAIGSTRPKRTLEPMPGDPIKVNVNGEKRKKNCSSFEYAYTLGCNELPTSSCMEPSAFP
ncbi:unnamed protein product [Urochloa humidicola]